MKRHCSSAAAAVAEAVIMTANERQAASFMVRV
jgi:hypothetical protein